MTEGATGAPRLLDGRYRLEGRIGSGGMGTVHRAHDTRLDRPVAVKLLRSTDDEVHRARLRAEAQFAGGLQHPGIVRVLDYGEERSGTDITPYLVMQLVDGEPLSERLRDGRPLSPAEVSRLLARVAEALAVAHEAGVVHRDLKPSNIVVTAEGQPVLVDFGVARSDTADPLTETGLVVGTADYLSPEQVEGARATPASDVYALGIVAHQCLTGTSPFHRETPVGTALAHLRDEVPELPSGVPTGLRTLVRAMLSRTPDARPSAAETATRAAAAPESRTVVVPPMPAAPPAPPQLVSPWTRRRIGVVAGAAMVLVGAVLAAAVQGHNPAAAPTAAAAGSAAGSAVSRHPGGSPTSTPTPTSKPSASTSKPPKSRPSKHPKPHHVHPPKHHREHSHGRHHQGHPKHKPHH